MGLKDNISGFIDDSKQVVEPINDAEASVNKAVPVRESVAATTAVQKRRGISALAKNNLIGSLFMVAILSCIIIGAIYWIILKEAVPYVWYYVFVPYIIAVVLIVLFEVWCFRWGQQSSGFFHFMAGGIPVAVFIVLVGGIVYACLNKQDTIDIYDNGIYYSIKDDGTLNVTRGYSSYKMERLEIPEQVNGRTVTSIGGRICYDNDNLAEVVLPSSITSIGAAAFYSCDNLESIAISEDVTSIGDSAFKDCSNLATVYWNATACTEAGSNSSNIFNGCSNLTTVEMRDGVTTIPSYVFQNCDGLVGISIPESVTSIGAYAFKDCNNLTSIVIPENLISIGSYAFGDCSSLETVYWNATACAEAGLAYFSIFNGCSNLTTVEIGNNVTTIPAYTFRNCDKLVSITIPESVTSIGDAAFDGCDRLFEVYNLSNLNIGAGSSNNGFVARYAKDVYVSLNEPSKLTITDDGVVFYEQDNDVHIITYIGNQQELILPNTFNGKSYEIDDLVFQACGLVSITIPDGVTSIGSYSFVNCGSLTNVTIGNGVTEIKKSAFSGCDNLTNVTIGNGVIIIRDDAFIHCEGLTSVYYTGDLESWCNIRFTKLYSNPLYYAHNLYIENNLITGIVIPNSITIVDSYAFVGINATYLVIHDNVTHVDETAFAYCNELRSITVKNGNETYQSVGNCLVNTKKRDLIRGCNNSVIPSDGSVTGIGNYAFVGCREITSIEIPNSVINIGIEAFCECCKLKNVKLGNSVKNIRRDAFSCCESLEQIVLPDSVTSLEGYTFVSCENLESITFGSGISFIGSNIFSGCSKINTINYNGTMNAWSQIKKELRWNYKANPWEYTNIVRTIVCVDGTVTVQATPS